MSPKRIGDFGSRDESPEAETRPSGMPWFATHCIVYTRGSYASERIEVMAWDRGVEAPGPARYALYTQANAATESEPEWAMDVEGRVWLRGESLPGDATASVEEIWA